MKRLILPRRRALILSGGALAAPMIASGVARAVRRLAEQAGTLHQRFSARRADRHAVANRLPPAGRAHRPAIHRRQQERVGRQCRHRRHRQGGARRLHDRPLHHRLAVDRADALRQAAVRRRQGFHRHRHDVVGAQHADDAARPAGQDGARADRAVRRPIPANTPSPRPGSGTSPHLSGEIFKQLAELSLLHVPYGQCARLPGSSGEPGRHDVRQYPGPARPDALGQGARARRDLEGTPSRRARDPDHGGVPAGLRDHLVGRHLRPGRTAAAMVEKLSALAKKALDSDAVKAAFDQQGATRIWMNPADTAAYRARTRSGWRRSSRRRARRWIERRRPPLGPTLPKGGRVGSSTTSAKGRTMQTAAPIDFRRWSTAAGTVDRRIFSDAGDLPGWSSSTSSPAPGTSCATSRQIPNAGDFFLNYIGEDRVIVVRDKDGGVSVLLNTCRHRGNAVCRAEEGHATVFMCTYHGWTYDLEGKLVGVPGFKDYYHEDLDREEWGLVSAPKVESYHGFVFATLDPEAPALDEYPRRRRPHRPQHGLPPTATWRSSTASRSTSSTATGSSPSTTSGTATTCRSTPRLGHHVGLTSRHAAATRHPRTRSCSLGEYGHAISGAAHRRRRCAQVGGRQPRARCPAVRRTLARSRREAKASCWARSASQRAATPTSSPTCGSPRAACRSACACRGARPATEIWWFTFVDRKHAAGTTAATTVAAHEPHLRPRRHARAGRRRELGPEHPWPRAAPVASRYPLNYSMNLGRGEVTRGRGRPALASRRTSTSTPSSGTYRAWADWMAAESWAALKRDHALPAGVV